MPQVKMVQLNLETLHDMGHGELGILIRNQLQRIARDCVDRPHDKTKRKVTIEISATPVINPQGEFTHTVVEIESKAKIPVHRSSPYQMQADMNGFKFNGDFPDSLAQLPLEEQD
jgi:hypothetical protein